MDFGVRINPAHLASLRNPQHHGDPPQRHSIPQPFTAPQAFSPEAFIAEQGQEKDGPGPGWGSAPVEHEEPVFDFGQELVQLGLDTFNWGRGDDEKSEAEEEDEQPETVIGGAMKDEEEEPPALPRGMSAFGTKMKSSAGADVIKKHGVKQSIYTKWIRDELEREQACLELPLTTVLLVSFALLSIVFLGQETISSVEHGITNDIIENGRFALAGEYGNKGFPEIRGYSDFWSWCRLGLVPIVAQPNVFSINLQQAVPPPYSVNNIPRFRRYPGFKEPSPMQNDYIRYNRIIGGFRLRQQVARASDDECIFPGHFDIFRRWLGKPCTDKTEVELMPDVYATERFENPQRVQWFLSDMEDYQTLLRRALDMEDGCTSAVAANRTCLCDWCAAQDPRHPWLNELTKRVEVSFIVYNPQYGIYTIATMNLWFNRAGFIHKILDCRSAWAGLEVRSRGELAVVLIAAIVWCLAALYMVKTEASEIYELIRVKNKPWYMIIVEDYLGFWNCVDWISIGMTAIIIILYVLLTLDGSATNESLSDFVVQSLASGSNQNPVLHLQQVEAFTRNVEKMCETAVNFKYWVAFYPVVVMLRLFKSFAAQPRLAIVTDTFKVATVDMIHFFIVFFSVYFCMTVNAVLFFGQTQVDFATLDRALVSCFRAMLGDWDWDGMREIGLHKAFLWFFTFMLVMVLLLLNMLLAILMEAYSTVKASTENADSLATQIRTMFRRVLQNRRGERVRLNDIWDALLEVNYKDDERMMKSEKRLTPEYLQDVVPGIPKSQALRTLTNSQADYDRINETPFSAEDLQEGLERMMSRVDDSVLCAAWLAEKMNQYTAEAEEGPSSGSIRARDLVGAQSNRSPPDGLGVGGLAAAKLAEERTGELADGIASVLGEEMLNIERRQKEQQRALEAAQRGMHSLRQLVQKLCRSCEQVGELAVGIVHDDAAGVWWAGQDSSNLPSGSWGVASTAIRP